MNLPKRRTAPHNRILAGCLASAVAVTTLAAEPTTAPQPVADSMHRLALDVRGLLPLIYQYEDTGTVANRAELGSRVDSMLSHAEEIDATIAPGVATYQVSYDILVSQLEQARDALASGNDLYGLGLLRSATSVCATCHTQDERAATWLVPEDDILEDPFIAGEFHFMTRQYDRAYDAYLSWLRQQETLEYEARTLAAFGRLLLTALQMQKSADSISTLLDEFAGRDDVEGLLRKDLQAWLAGIRSLQQQVDITSHPPADRVAHLATLWLTDGEQGHDGHLILAESQRPAIVWLRGHLYRALMNETEADRVPQWLYWLALSDRVLEYRFHYSLADMYLKQCMLDYTDNPIARQCYREYENYIAFFYSGSSGTHIPDDIKEELSTLEARVFASPPPSSPGQ